VAASAASTNAERKYELLTNLRTADRSLRLPSPTELEALPAPSDDGLRFDDDQDLPPILPEVGENHPEEAIPPMELRPVNFREFSVKKYF